MLWHGKGRDRRTWLGVGLIGVGGRCCGSGKGRSKRASVINKVFWRRWWSCDHSKGRGKHRVISRVIRDGRPFHCEGAEQVRVGVRVNSNVRSRVDWRRWSMLW